MNHELRFCASRSTHRIDIEFIYQGLHEFPAKLKSTLEEALNRVDVTKYNYILLNYGLCGNGTLNISHPKIPIVIHNVHDCMPLLIGSYGLHREYMLQRPGTFWFSVGWVEGFPLPGSPDYVEKYIEFYNTIINEKQRDAIERMLMENYGYLTFVRWDELGKKVAERGCAYTRECVNSINKRLGFNLKYDELRGSPGKIQRFVDGEWNSNEFLIIEPGQTLRFDALKSSLYVE